LGQAPRLERPVQWVFYRKIVYVDKVLIN